MSTDFCMRISVKNWEKKIGLNFQVGKKKKKKRKSETRRCKPNLDVLYLFKAWPGTKENVIHFLKDF